PAGGRLRARLLLGALRGSRRRAPRDELRARQGAAGAAWHEVRRPGLTRPAQRAAPPVALAGTTSAPSSTAVSANRVFADGPRAAATAASIVPAPRMRSASPSTASM